MEGITSLAKDDNTASAPATDVVLNNKDSGNMLTSSAGGKSGDIGTPNDSVSVDLPSKITNVVTTTFVDDAVTVQRDETMVTHIDEALIMLQDPQESVDDIISFLKKPIVLETGTFAISDVYTIFNSFNLPSALFNSTAGLIWANKLQGFFGIRCDIRVKLVVNANKFQQGRYILGWTPLASPVANTSSLKNIQTVYAHNASLTARTTVPHVEIDLATESSAEMLIPFVSVDSFYPINNILGSNSTNSLGYLSVYPYSPLVSPTGSSSAYFTVYASLENVKLFGSASAQAGVSDREVSNKNNGPISGLAKAVSKGFKEFGNIPLIGEYCQGISWISDRISKTASIFGFSKPTAGDSIPKMQIMNIPSHTTVDGDSDAKALSYLSKPGTIPVKGLAGTEYDEMDFSFIKSKYAYFRTFEMTDVQATGTQLTSILVGPGIGQTSVTTLGNTYVNFTPVAFLAKQFRFWRGSIRFRFKIVKTEYHSGRIEVGFYPSTELYSYTANSSYVNRAIVDIRDCTEMEFVIPYIHQRPWCTNDYYTGFVNVKVVDPLVRPASVSSSITFLVEISGGPDFEVAGPGAFDYVPAVYVPQGYYETENATSAISEVIGGSSIKSDPNVHTSMTIGDKVSSVRSLVKRFTPIESNIKISGSTMDTTQMCVIPDAVLFRASNTAGESYFGGDTISLWASCYALMSGGIRLRNVTSSSLTDYTNKHSMDTNSAFLITHGSDTCRIVTDTAITSNHTSMHRAYCQYNNNCLTVEVPQYTRTFARAVSDLIMFQANTDNGLYGYKTTSSGTNFRVMFCAPASLTVTTQSAYTFHNIFRAAADDFNLSCFISVPPMIATTTFKAPAFY